MAVSDQHNHGQRETYGLISGHGRGKRRYSSNGRFQGSRETNGLSRETRKTRETNAQSNQSPAGRRGHRSIWCNADNQSTTSFQETDVTATIDARDGAQHTSTSKIESIPKPYRTHDAVDAKKPSHASSKDIRAKSFPLNAHLVINNTLRKIEVNDKHPSPSANNEHRKEIILEAGDRAVITNSLPRLSPFQRLPGELRWAVYEHVFTVHRVEVLRLKDKDPAKHAKRVHYRLYQRQLQPRNPSTQVINSRRPRYPMPFAVLLTCRSMYCDTLCLFYARTQFIFNTTRTLARFLKITSKDAQMAVEHVELNHVMYSEPALLHNRWWKAMSDMAWFNACDDLRVYCKSLKVLHVDMTVRDWPIDLEVGEMWSLPLLAFARYGPVMDWVDIRLRMPRFQEDKLAEAARELEERIMKPKAFQRRRDERLARQLAGPVRTRILRLVF